MMTKCYLDSNILLYYIFEDSDYFNDVRDLLISLRVDKFDIYISPLTLDEFAHQMDHLSRTSKHRRKDYYYLLEIMIDTILNMPNLIIINPPISSKKQRKMIELMQKYNLRPRDAYHILTILENDIEYIATYDKDFDKVIKSGIIKKYN